MNRGILTVAISVVLSVVATTHAGWTDNPVDDSFPRLNEQEGLEVGGAIDEHLTMSWNETAVGIITPFMPKMTLAGIDPNNPVPNYGPYPHDFASGDPVSFTMVDRALSQQELVTGQQQVIVELQAQTQALIAHTTAVQAETQALTAAVAALTAAVGNVQTELVTGRVETAKIATNVEALATNGVNVSVTMDNTTLVQALQQLITNLQTGQTLP